MRDGPLVETLAPFAFRSGHEIPKLWPTDGGFRMAKKNESSFDRDFGYLMPFLDRVADAAKGLADPAARARLTELMAEEKERWAEIRALVSGAPAKAASSSTRRNATAAKPSPRAPSQAETPRTRTGEPPASLTVGSLRRRG